MFKLKRRDGTLTAFDLGRIKEAIRKAFDATSMIYNEDILDILVLRVTANFQTKIKDDSVALEDVQDSVEKTLEQTGYTEVAKAYILYRKQREKLRNMKSTLVDYKNIINSYVKSEDWRVKENSTVTYSVGGLILHNSGAVTANYWLSEIYDAEVANLHKEGDFHIHDLSMLTAYCAGWSLKQLIQEGLGGVSGKITSAPASHLHTIVNQMVNFLGIMQNEWAGAQAFSSFDTYLAPFVKVDNLTYREVKQAIQAFVFGINIPSRWGTQSPFSNITLDWVCPDDLKKEKGIVGGKEQDFTYGECQKEMDIINKAFLEIMIGGDASGRGFQYPIPTYNITRDFNWDTDNARLLFEMTAKYGTPYFQNFVNSDMSPGDVRSMCCRLQLDKRELLKKTGGLFGSGEKTGSVGVVTINLPRIAYHAKSKDDFYKRLRYLMGVAKRSLEVKREVCIKLLEQNFYPYTKRYLGNFNAHFSTIGLIGMNEMCLNAAWVGDDIASVPGIKFSQEVLDFMREELKAFQEETGNLYNLEATPAESTTYRLAKMDNERWAGIKTASNDSETPFYTNSCHLPVNYTTDPFKALEIQDDLQTRFTGGTVFHTFLGEKLPSWEIASNLVKKISYSYRLPYFTISPTYTICDKCGYIPGEKEICPKCGVKTEVYSRITGYYRPTKHWNEGKQQEFSKRTEYDIEKKEACCSPSEPETVINSEVQGIKEQGNNIELLTIPGMDRSERTDQKRADNSSTGSFFKSGFSSALDPEIRYKKENLPHRVMLFTTKSCPNCPKAKVELKDSPNVEFVDAEENWDISKKYGIRTVPALVVDDGKDYRTYTGVSDIIQYRLESVK
jgi:ribonucleoside-triphosphate reductase (formate)